jgi:MFS transporter, FSR family, fosmidomycin resistance protein
LNSTSIVLVATSLGHFINDGLNNIFPIVYPLLLIAPYDYSYFSISIVGAILSLSSIATAPLIGRRSDLGKNFNSLMSIGIVVIVAGLIGFSLSMARTGGMNLLILLVLASAVAGLGTSFYHPIAAAILNQAWPKATRAFAMGVNGSVGTVGNLILPIIADFVIVRYGILSLVGMGAFGVAVASVMYLLMRSAYLGSDRLARPNSEARKESVDLPSRKGGVSLRIVLISMFALTLVSFFRGAFFSGIQVFLPTYLERVDNVPYALLGVAISVVPAAGIISQPVFGRLADRFDLRTIIALTQVGGVISMAVFILSPNFIIAETFLGVSGAFQFTGFPLLLALASQIAPRGAVTLSNSIVWGLGTVAGGAVGPVLVGLLSGPAILGSLSLAFEMLLIIGITGVVFVPFIPKPARVIESVS